jgi:hypothetical protein
MSKMEHDASKQNRGAKGKQKPCRGEHTWIAFNEINGFFDTTAASVHQCNLDISSNSKRLENTCESFLKEK